MASSAISAIAAKMAGKDSAPAPGEPVDDGGGDDQGLQMAMADFMDAVDAKDPVKMADAFKNACAICEGSESPDQGE